MTAETDGQEIAPLRRQLSSTWPRIMWRISLIERPPVASTLDVLTLPWAFSQTRLLDAGQFQREARNRGLAGADLPSTAVRKARAAALVSKVFVRWQLRNVEQVR